MQKGSWSILDQALFAGANFLVNVMLARWLSPEAYGAFAVAFVVFLLVGTVHGGLFVEPMLVFGPGRFEGRAPAYLRVLLRGHAMFAAATGVLLAAIGVASWALGEPSVMTEFLTLGIASGLILTLWMMRRACYVVDRPQWAVGAGVLYLVLLLSGAWALTVADRLTGATTFALMAAGSLAASLVLAYRIGLFGSDRPDGTLAQDVREAHGEYGRWAAPTGLLEWVHGSLPLLVLPIFVGLEGSGTFRALFNLAQPALHGFSALAVVALPIFVRARSEGRLRSVAFGWGGGIVVLGVLYAVLTLVAGPWAVDVLYDGKYPVGTVELVCLSLLPLAAAVSGVMMTWLRSAERPKDVFRARAWAVGVASTVGVALTAAFSVAGALLADVLAIVVEALAQVGAVRQSTPMTGAVPPRQPGRLRVVQSAYACFPGAGSEPAVGWNTAREMARHHDVWVITYAAWKDAVEAELTEHPVPGLHVEYVALPFERRRHRSGAVDRTGIAEQIHYFRWQRAAARVAKRLHQSIGFDLAHHVTHVKFWAPTAVHDLGIPFIWGPVGGGESAPASFYPALGGAGKRYEERRDLARRVGERLPGALAAARGATIAFAATDESAERMRAMGAENVEVRSGIGLSQKEIDRLAEVGPPDDGPVRFVCIGRQIAWKGYRFAIDAFAQAATSGGREFEEAELWMVGDGPEHDRLREAIPADLVDRVRMFGRVPREQVLEMLSAAHVLVQTSLHDSGGGVCLEAMAAGRAVVGFDLGGTPVQVGDTGVLVPARTPDQAVGALADAFRQLAADPDLRRRLGAAGRARVAQEFAWSTRIADLAGRYRDAVGQRVPLVDAPEPPLVEPALPV